MTFPRLVSHSAFVVAALLVACGDARDHKPAAQDSTATTVAQTARATAQPEGAASEARPGPAPITEAELGVPLYPGAALLQAQSSRTANVDGTTVVGTFETADAPASVAAFYRDHLRGRAPADALMETKTDAGQVLMMLNDPAANSAVQVEIGTAGKGARVQVTAVQFPPR